MTLLEGRHQPDADASAGSTQPREEFVYVAPDDARARPLLTDLEREYDARYGDIFGEPASVELSRYPAEEFSAPRGAFVLLLRDGVAVAGGAFKTLDEHTTELKRIWTAAEHRREGLARRVVFELEEESRRRGFTRSYLTTGPRQPEAVRLYLSAHWTPLFDTTEPPERVGIHGFAKSLTDEPLNVEEIRGRHDAEQAEFRAHTPEFAARLAAEAAEAAAAPADTAVAAHQATPLASATDSPGASS